MKLYRITFIESLVKESQNLRIVFLNHSGAPASLLTDISTIDLLADIAATKSFLHFCTTHPIVERIAIQSSFKTKGVLVTMIDGSELNFQLIEKKIRFALNCLSVKEIYNHAKVNAYGMLVPSLNHHFEYLVLKNQFNKTTFPDKFQKFFSSLITSQRTELFQYIQPKYNLVYNTLEDLYLPKGGVHLKLTIGLRKRKGNSMLWMILRLFGKSIFFIKHLFTNDTVYYVRVDGDTITTAPIEKRSRRKRVAF